MDKDIGTMAISIAGLFFFAACCIAEIINDRKIKIAKIQSDLEQERLDIQHTEKMYSLGFVKVMVNEDGYDPVYGWRKANETQIEKDQS